MEGKEINNDDDLLKSGSDKDKNEESDDFGLPETPFDDKSEEKGEEPESNSYSPGSISDSEKKAEALSKSSHSEESKSPVGLIVTLIIIGVVAIVIAAYFLFLKKPKEPVIVEEEPAVEAVDSTLLQSPVEEPVEKEPAIEETAVQEPIEGVYQTLTARTGRYYVIIGSFVDLDLATDYAKKLAANGVNSTILSPEGKGFHRLAIAGDFNSFSDASMQVEEVKGNYGPEVWVLKY